MALRHLFEWLSASGGLIRIGGLKGSDWRSGGFHG